MYEMMPYNFVPLREGGKTRVSEQNMRDRSLLDGKIACRLTVQTPLFIPNTSGDRKDRVFYSYDDLTGVLWQELKSPEHPVIPGSSIRGVLRSTFEAAANGCMSVFRTKYGNAAWENMFALAERAGYLPCMGGGDLCPACSLFGMVSARHGGRAYAGRVRVTDAKPSGQVVYGKRRRIPVTREPHVEAAHFYTKATQEGRAALRGRKFYWHFQPSQLSGNDSDVFIQPIERGTFDFDVYFDGVTREELTRMAALITLRGENGYRGQFKMGACKPFGYGSVSIDIRAIAVRELALTDEGVVSRNEDVTAQYAQATLEKAFGESEALSSLRIILDPKSVAYDSVRVEYKIWPFALRDIEAVAAHVYSEEDFAEPTDEEYAAFAAKLSGRSRRGAGERNPPAGKKKKR